MHLVGPTHAWRLRAGALDAPPRAAGWHPGGGAVAPPGTAALRVLFPTTFSAGCRRAGLALAQLSRTCPVALTVVHATRRGAWNAAVGRDLASALSDVPGLAVDDRTLLFGDDPADLVGALCANGDYDLVVAPASEVGRLRGLLHRSFRARLLARCGVPLWTSGAGLPPTASDAPLGRVACLLDLEDAPAALLATAAAFAVRLGASLHAVAVVPPVDEGTLSSVLGSHAPLSTAEAVARLAAPVHAHGCQSLDVADGDLSVLPALVARCHADLLVVGRRHAAAAMRGRLARALDRLACPVVLMAPPRAAVTGVTTATGDGWASWIGWPAAAPDRR